MNSWSRTRKRIILGIVLFVLVVLVGVPMYFLFHKTPTCSDGVRNGDEGGVDCGGSCRKLCTVESLPLVVKGDPRVIKVASSTYEVVALLENANADAQISRAHYTFRVYGSQSLVPLQTIEGDTFVPKGSTFAIFEGPIDFSQRDEPTRATIEWNESTLVWEKNPTPLPNISVENFNFTASSSKPRLEAALKNDSLTSVSNIELTALLFDGTGSIFAASKTFVNTIEPTSVLPVIFTWPGALSATPVEVKIITRVLPDQSFIK